MKEFKVEHTAIPTDLVQAPAPRPVEQKEIIHELNGCVRGQLKPSLSGLLVLFLFFVLNEVFVEQTPFLTSPAGLVAAITAASFLLLRMVLQVWTLPPRWAHPVVFFVFGLLLINIFLPEPLGADSFHTVYLLLLLVGSSCLFLSMPWFSVAMMTALCAWLYFLLTAPNQESWIRYGFSLFTATVLSILVQAVRVMSYSRQAFSDVNAADRKKNLTEAVTVSRRSEERFRRLSQATVEGIAVHQKGRIVDANESMAAMFGYKIEELAGLDLLGLLSLESREAIAESMVLGNFKAFEAVGMRRSGTQFPVEIFNNPVAQDEEGTMVMAIRDITERKASEQNLALETMRLQRQFKRQSALAGMELAVDQPSELFPLLQRIADAASDLLPCSGGVSIILRESNTEEYLIAASTIQGHTPLSLVAPEHCGPNSLLGWVFENKDSMYLPDASVDPLGVGQMFPDLPIMAYAALPLMSEERLLGVFLLLESEAKIYKQEDYDFLNTLANRSALVVAKVQLYERLRNANQLLEQQSSILQRNNVEMAEANLAAETARRVLELEHAELESKNTELARAKEAADIASRAKTAFLANISHELTTPMNGILGMTSLLQTTPLTDEQTDYLTTLNVSAEHLLSLINDILDYTKMEMGQLDLATDEFDLRGQVEQAVKGVSSLARAKGLELVYCEDATLPLRVTGDPRRLTQVIHKILDNAIKFTERGEVVLRVAKEREFDGSVTLAFEIRDTGIGLSSEAISLLFGAFQQHDGSDTRSFGGAGMGLAFCRHLVRLMGGQIGVESVEGQGSVFRFSISLLCESQSATSDELLALPNAGPILVVDDNTASRLALVYYLESWHCRAIPASGGKEAAAIFQEALLTANPIALILADHHMPGMDGLRLAEAIGKAPPSRRPRFVLMTLGEFPSQEVLYSAGIDACLPKPVLPRQLKDVLTQVLG